MLLRSLVWLVLPLATCAERVVVLPGFGEPPTAHFSGFVEVEPSSGTHLFYYLVESQSSPKDDPLLWWMNGGPGASSLVGLLAANGPLLLNEAGRFMNNPYAWNRQANILYVEFGPGVGYSFCANSSKTTGVACLQERGDCSPCSASDSSVARQSVAAIETLLTEVFPDMAGKPLYLTGESYAGVYAPTLAAAMFDHFQDTSIVNLHGIWVTDPCMDNKAQFGWLDLGVDFAVRNSLISQEVYKVLTDPANGCGSGRTAVGDRIRKVGSDECRRAWRLYDLATAGTGDAVHPRQVPGLPMYIDPLFSVGLAGGVDMAAYLNRTDVREALHTTLSPNKVYHVELGNNGYPEYTLEYAACNDNPSGPLGKTSMLDVYRDLAATSRHSKVAANFSRIIINSGDLDPVVNGAGTEAAVEAIGFPVAEGGDRRPWFFNAAATAAAVLGERPVKWGPSLRSVAAGVQVGGFIVNYDTGLPDLSLDFVIFRNSGHMVPAYAPQTAFHVIEAALLQGRPLSPRLPEGFSSGDDEAFYGYKAPEGGAFSAWVQQAMSCTYVGECPNQVLEHQSVIRELVVDTVADMFVVVRFIFVLFVVSFVVLFAIAGCKPAEDASIELPR
ncbi:unnamed protein product [Polarella glacialis]|uniref:Carboxypeptidase n=1 Tax=Polarella glacialis TaxID=89957 RepID=A0A813GAS0_POLGL|nr:unnamed protein product [Polarella glacialis]